MIRFAALPSLVGRCRGHGNGLSCALPLKSRRNYQNAIVVFVVIQSRRGDQPSAIGQRAPVVDGDSRSSAMLFSGTSTTRDEALRIKTCRKACCDVVQHPEERHEQSAFAA